jgi:cysteine desulfurase
MQITVLPVNRRGELSVTDFVKALGPQTLLVSIMHANNETGVIQPIEELADIIRARGIVFHTDAVQSAGLDALTQLPNRTTLLDRFAQALANARHHGARLLPRNQRLPQSLFGGVADQVHILHNAVHEVG